MAKTNEKVGVKYRMRHNNVLIRKERVDQVRGLFMPECSIQGMQFVVAEVGPEVENLKAGDRVLMKGTRGSNYYELPHDNNLIVIDDEGVVLVYEPDLES